uniref:Myb-like domain-containing protein n=1 Tax=Oryza brachyantha TaxID=4533 RepID=J3MBQ1_ORYBR
MNPLVKEGIEHLKRTKNSNPSSWRGNGVHAARNTVADVEGACVSAAHTGTSSTQAVDDRDNYSPPISISPIGGWWPSTREGLYPQGGFTNYLQSSHGNNLEENFHFVGNIMRQSTMSPNDLCSKGTPSPVANNPVHIIDTEEKEAIDVDDDTLQGSRTHKRLNWSREEDTRLASAWLHNSKDPIDGTSRKIDQY